ncbi:response regulator [Paenibacillus sp. MMS20-IR301]|uniref:response regulator n=1 Tax=Paenibacillus sp. MMS20-IR301 TaxID=2895946 RepID=UPI0028EF1170|nr:response regulator [Paenibacillus sp. MMS20-IR301]WNS45156.1 response regulator [Paenibacillus sp. MMS20-IR301]
MYSLLIVDDHKHQVDTLAVTLPWEQFGITSVHKAYDSRLAQELLRDIPIDIMITDIRMPGISGLELISFINENQLDTDCILLTGYAEFEYAKKAIELHAVDYFIKPVRDELLLDTVDKIIDKRRRHQQHSRMFEHATAVLHQNLPLLKENLLLETLQGSGYTRNYLTEKLRMYQLPYAYGDSVKLMVINFESSFYETYTSADIKLLEYAVMNMAEDLLSPHFHVWNRIQSEINLTLLLLPRTADCTGDSDHWSPSSRELLSALANRLLEQVDHYLKQHVIIAISGTARFPEDIHGVYSSVLSSVIKSAERQGVIVLEQPGISRSIAPLRSLYQSPTLIQLMDQGKMEKLNDKFQQIFTELETRESDSRAHLREAYLHLLSSFTYLAHKNGKVLEDITGTASIHAERSVIHSARQLKAWSRIIIEALIDQGPAANDETHQQLVNKIHSYIQENLERDVTLQSISEYVYLHSVYLSKLYKEITGLNLSEYILRARMTEAKRLLEHTAYKIYEITEKVGYQSPQHFIRRFKQYYGVTPDIFRKQ